MENWQLGILVKPLVVLLLFFVARWLSWRLLERLPEGRLKRLLSVRW